MTLDFETRERDLRLAYLFRGEYHDKSGKLRVVHWCGPKSRTGSGLTLDVPSGARGGLSADPTGDAVVWESRMNGCTLDAKLGNITQVIQAITDLNFNVDISGGPRATLCLKETSSMTLSGEGGGTTKPLCGLLI